MLFTAGSVSPWRCARRHDGVLDRLLLGSGKAIVLDTGIVARVEAQSDMDMLSINYLLVMYGHPPSESSLPRGVQPSFTGKPSDGFGH